MKVFLGGTCAGWKWRDELQPLLKIMFCTVLLTELKVYIQLQKLLTIQTNARRKQYFLICIKHMREAENLSRWHIA